ncbi:DNA repair protein RecO [Cyanobacterium stanieri LEGE 03274]|uniref:DNA repair protein RecO n=1 Tax=Cyanobacterium stanieri LEGE 03274 TaxID=1828756 RepID=A0ABR9V571_9CHRO|nr:DNA repair protein RecO [Cyanobacterium stanieri]MBE9223038.1 DNA repair protein RecO [Cyanobacterium stanieri LEGE 03274]
MSQTYQTTAIILKQKPFGENDLLVTIFSPERGLVRAIAPGARKYKSRLRGRIQPLVINEFLVVKGTSLDRLIQAETKESYPKLSQNLGKLTISQYLAEIILNLALIEQPQQELYNTFNRYLKTLEQLDIKSNLTPHLAQGVFNVLTLTGIAPEVNYCLRNQTPLIPNLSQSHWRIGFSFYHGGFIELSALNNDKKEPINAKFSGLELCLLQCLAHRNLENIEKEIKQIYSQKDIDRAWMNIERNLTKYIEFYLGYTLKSAEMVNFALNYPAP